MIKVDYSRLAFGYKLYCLMVSITYYKFINLKIPFGYLTYLCFKVFAVEYKVDI